MPGRVKSPVARGLGGGCKMHDEATARIACCTMFHVHRGAIRSSDGLCRLTNFFPALDPPRSAGGYWRGVCGVFDGVRSALIVRCWASGGIHGTYQAKEQPKYMMVNILPSKTKDTLCISYSRQFLPMPSILVAARLASFSLSSLWFYCFAANTNVLATAMRRLQVH